jgi:hypothetical protein
MSRRFRMTALAALALTGPITTAEAAPILHLSTRSLPISGFPHTGNIAGAGASLSAELTIMGTEYGGYPPPLTHLKLTLPQGMLWNARGFPTCNRPVLEPGGPPGPWPAFCPPGSVSEHSGVALLAVTFGTEVVPESTTVETIYHTGNGVSIYVSGPNPVLVEDDLTTGLFTQHAAALAFEVGFPLLETVPNAEYVSTLSVGFDLGTGFISTSGKHIFSLHMPRRCPQHRLLFQVEADFAGMGPLPGQKAVASYRAPCPKDLLRAKSG